MSETQRASMPLHAAVLLLLASQRCCWAIHLPALSREHAAQHHPKQEPAFRDTALKSLDVVAASTWGGGSPAALPAQLVDREQLKALAVVVGPNGEPVPGSGAQVGRPGLLESASLVEEDVSMGGALATQHGKGQPEMPSVSTACTVFSLLWVVMHACVPLIIGLLHENNKLTQVHIGLSVGFFVWLISTVYLLRYVFLFSSTHWDGNRGLTMPETVYLMSTCVTTVGYGDILPVGSPGKLYVAFFSLSSVLLLADIVVESMYILFNRVLVASKDTLVHEFLVLEEAFEHTIHPSEAPAGQTMLAGAKAPEQLAAPKDIAALMEARLRRDWKRVSAMLAVGASAWLFNLVVGLLYYTLFRPREEEGVDLIVQAVYWAIVTSTTLGFGDVTPLTEGGMVFCAFWVTTSVASLASLALATSKMVAYLREAEQLRLPQRNTEFLALCSRLRTDSQTRIDRYEFLKLLVLQSRAFTEGDVNRLEKMFQHLGPDSRGLVDFAKVQACWKFAERSSS